MTEAVIFGLGWIIVAGVVGGALGSIATGTAGLAIWAFSGIAVGAAQWGLVYRRLSISPRWWVVATAFGAFVTILVHLYLGTLITKGARSFLDLATRFGGELLLDSILLALVGGLTLGVSQATVLRDTPIRSSAWISATTLGVLAAWLGDLWLLVSAVGDLPRHIGMAAHIGGFWAMLCLPQAVLIARAVKRAMPISCR